MCSNDEVISGSPGKPKNMAEIEKNGKRCEKKSCGKKYYYIQSNIISALCNKFYIEQNRFLCPNNVIDYADFLLCVGIDKEKNNFIM